MLARTVSSLCKRSGPYRPFPPLRRTELFTFESIIARGKWWKSGTRIWFRAWTSVSLHLASVQDFRHSTMKWDINKLTLPRKIDTRLLSGLRMALRYGGMPFVLNREPETFQLRMNVLLTKGKWEFAHLCLNGIVIYWRTPNQYIGHIRRVRTLMYDAGRNLNLNNANSLQIASIISIMSFPARPSKFWHRPLKQYVD